MDIQVGGIHRFRWENPWIFFKESTPCLNQPILATVPSEHSIKRLGLRDSLRFVFFFVFPNGTWEIRPGVFVCFFRVEDGRYILDILWKYMTWIYTFHLHALSRKMGGTMMKQMKSHVNITQPKKGCACFRTSTRVGPQQSTCVSLFFNAIYLEPLST